MIELLHQIVDDSAERDPDKAAFRFEGEPLSYGELMQRANGLARLLHANGVKPGDRVALLLPKSLELPVAVFGCLKAGAIVVPMDAQSPLDRLAVMLADAGIRCAVVLPDQQKLVTGLLELQVDLATIIGLPNDDESSSATMPWSAVADSDKPPPLDLGSDSPAYLLFTSGSTGQPKGILHSHGSALAYARLAADMYGVESQDRLGNFAPLHFDQSTFEFYCGPLRGATTVLIPPAYGIMVASLADIIEKEALTFWYSVPSVLVRMLQSDALVNRDLTNIRWVLFGGEVFPQRQLERLMALLPEAQFSNVYGPTEVNQCTSFNFRGDDKIPEPLPIGKVWGETQALVVDENDVPVEAGEIGELLIHSSTMMTGYWERPDLNDRAFHAHALDNGSEIRFYRTGDLVKADSDGNLVFLGRRDRQVKSRGFRVELDEVESVLSQLDGVEEAATFTVVDESGMLLIDAAVRLRSDSGLTVRDIAAQAARLLPGYARPRKVHILDDFPRTRTGKIDRNAVAELTRKLCDVVA